MTRILIGLGVLVTICAMATAAALPTLPMAVAHLTGVWEGAWSNDYRGVITITPANAQFVHLELVWQGLPEKRTRSHRLHAVARVVTGPQLRLETSVNGMSIRFVQTEASGQLEGTMVREGRTSTITLRRRPGAATEQQASVPPEIRCSSLDAFLTRITAASDAAARKAAVDELVATAKARMTPLIDSIPRSGFGCATFLYQGEAVEVALAGDFNGWSTASDYLTRVPGTDLFYLCREFELDARLDYKLLPDGQWALDPLNPRTMLGGYGPNSQFWMPGYVAPVEVEAHPEIPHGTLDRFALHAKRPEQSRTLTVYLPSDYAETKEALPVLYVHDGEDYLNFAEIQNIMDLLIHERRIPPVIVVMVPPKKRHEEYAMNLQFEEFLIKEVVPAIDGRYRSRRDPAFRAVAGISMGGNEALSLALRHPDVFGRCAAQSSGGPDGDFFDLLDLIQKGPKPATRFYLDVGIYESNQDGSDLLDYTRQIHAAMLAKDYELKYREVHEGHSWGNWRARIGDALVYFWGEWGE
ncbi:MAG: alpha/beta hydrolase-fold protein [Acidobacteriota bacterium]